MSTELSVLFYYSGNQYFYDIYEPWAMDEVLSKNKILV